MFDSNYLQKIHNVRQNLDVKRIKSNKKENFKKSLKQNINHENEDSISLSSDIENINDINSTILLQETSEKDYRYTDEKKQCKNFAKNVIKKLKILQIKLLDQNLTHENISIMQYEIDNAPEINDPELKIFLEDVKLRLAVETAKLEYNSMNKK